MKIYKKEQIKEWNKQYKLLGHRTSDGLALICSNKLAKHIRKTKNKSFLFLIGPSNNGDIGILCANQLVQEGYLIEAINLCNEGGYHLDEKIVVHNNIRESIKAISEHRYIIDCLFSYDFDQQIEYPFDAIIDAVNKKRHYVISCDTASGVNCDNGQLSPIAIKANETITFQFPKLGQFIYPGNEYSGEVILETIDNLAIEIDSNYQYVDTNQIASMIPIRRSHSHKGDYGKVLAIVGSETMTGSALLTCTAMMKTGVGLLTVFSCSKVIDVIRNNLPEAMTIEFDDNNFEYQLASFDFSKYDLIVVGSGLSKCERTSQIVRAVLSTNLPVVVDGDGLNYIKENKYLLNRSQLTVLTPHLGEYQRIFDYSQKTIVDDLELIGKKYPNLAIVLKSERTIISFRSEMYFNVVGNNALAKAGTGDVLCGTIGSFLAQKFNIESIVAAVFLHSYAADQYVKKNSYYSMLATDVINYMDLILRTITRKDERS